MWMLLFLLCLLTLLLLLMVLVVWAPHHVLASPSAVMLHSCRWCHRCHRLHPRHHPRRLLQRHHHCCCCWWLNLMSLPLEYLHVDEGLYYYGEDHCYGEGRVSVVMTLEQLM